MSLQEIAYGGIASGAMPRIWADGTDEQEDELDDVAKGKLHPPTDTEGEGSIDDRNDRGRELESEDEDDALVRRIEESGHPEPEDEDGRMEELARKAGIRLPN